MEEKNRKRMLKLNKELINLLGKKNDFPIEFLLH